jgi:glyoxylase-like metal-dependent hydrolase (beta-lactamase superfamily II)
MPASHSASSTRVWTVLRAIVGGLVVTLLAGSTPFGLLLKLNARYRPDIPWLAALELAFVLALLAWLNGFGPPRSTAAARRFHLRLWRRKEERPSGAGGGEVLLIVGLIVAINVAYVAASSVGGPRPAPDLGPYPTTAIRFSALIMGALLGRRFQRRRRWRVHGSAREQRDREHLPEPRHRERSSPQDRTPPRRDIVVKIDPDGSPDKLRRARGNVMIIRSVGGLIAALCLIALPAAAQAPAPAGDLPFKLQQVGPGVYAAVGGPMAGSNAGFVVGDDGVLVVDSFFYPDAARALLAQIRKLTDKPVRYVVNTHYHIDHVSGDAVFKAGGASIIAHRNVPGWIHGENVHLMGGDKIRPEIKAQIDALIPPDRTVDKTTVLTLGKRRIELRPVTGHTGGDLEVSVPDAKVVFAGDILWNHISPTTIDGRIITWTQDLARLEALPGPVAFVPGHGEVASAKDVDDLKALFEDLTRLTREARRQGLAGDALAQSVAGELIALHPGWTRLERNAAVLAAQMDQELAGAKRVPTPAD